MAAKLQAVVTPATLPELREALLLAWRSTISMPPPVPAITLLLAHVALETGRGKDIRAYNVGNHKAPTTDVDHCYFTTWECVEKDQAARMIAASTPGASVEWVREEPDGRIRIKIRPEHPWGRFRAFRSLEEGCEHHVERLRTRFGAAWLPLCDGDVRRYARELAREGYFTASVDSYARQLVSLAREVSQPDVRTVQQALAALNYDPGRIDGVMGPRTRGALLRFQDARGLAPTGDLSTETIAALALSDDRGYPLT